MPGEQEAKLARELSIQNQILDLQKKEAEIEDKKADTLLKRLSALEKISNLMKEGIVQNDSDIQIMINDILYIHKTPLGIKGDDIGMMEVNEQVEDKEDEN